MRPKRSRARRARRCWAHGGKVRFRSWSDATAALSIFARGTYAVPVPVRAYTCLRCGGWHLTSQT